MANYLVKGQVRCEPRLKVASTAISTGALLATDGSGAVTPATSSTNFIVGMSTRTVVSTDSDYAANTEIPVIMPNDNAIYQLDVTTGTLTAAAVGLAFDLTNSLGVDVTGTTKKVVTCVGFISATVGLFKLNSRESDANHA